jgi:RNA polymerase sigma-70 factor, ECF subfamily
MKLSDEERGRLNAAMDRYADGDDASFAEVYDLLATRLLAFLVRACGDHARAEDMVQQTLLQMHAARRNYVTGSDVIPWAFAIARNLAIDARRRTRKELLFSTAEAHGAALGARVDRASNPGELAMARQMAEHAKGELERLPEAQRAAYDLVRNEGLSVADAAQVLGTTTTAVKLRVHRVYNALRGILGADEAPCDKRRAPEPVHPIEKPV